VSARRVIAACYLVLGVAGCGASASSMTESGAVGNACNVDADCGDGRCLKGVCVARSNAIDYVMVEISPPSDSGSGAYGNAHFLKAYELGTGGELDVTLEFLAELAIAVSPPGESCSVAGLDANGYLPIAVTATADSAINGIATSTVEGESNVLLGSGDQGNIVTLSLAPGPVDLYIAPTSETATSANAADAEGVCDLAPLLARGQLIESGVVSLVQQMLPAEHVNVEVTVPAGVDGASPLTGWTLDMVEPFGGRRLSSRALLSGATNAEDGRLQHAVRLAYHSVLGVDAERLKGTELFRLTPPSSILAPTYYVARSAMDLFDASSVVLSQVTSFPSPVVVTGLVESEADGTPLRADIVATLEPGDLASTGALAYFQATTSTDAAGHFELKLLSGKYEIVAIPSATTPHASQSVEWSVAANPPIQAGKLIQVGPMATMTGVVYSELHREPLAGVTLSASPSSLGKRPTFLDELLGQGAPIGVRTQMVVADERGAFEIPVDEGRYDVAVRPAEGSGYSWAVRTSMGVEPGVTTPLNIELRNPVAYTGTVTIPGRSAGGARVVLPGTLLRFYALFDEGGLLAEPNDSAVSGVEIGHARADAAGTYRLLLPDRLD
jgi:hypothetical protein